MVIMTGLSVMVKGPKPLYITACQVCIKLSSSTCSCAHVCAHKTTQKREKEINAGNQQTPEFYIIIITT